MAVTKKKDEILQTAKELFHNFFKGAVNEVQHLTPDRIKALKAAAHKFAEIWHSED